MIALLVSDSRVDVNKSNPLVEAVSRNHVDIVELLLARADLQLNESDSYSYGGTALKIAVEGNMVDMVELLLAQPGIKINQKASSAMGGRNLLLEAVSRNHVDIVELLLARTDLQLNEVDHANQTALKIAVVQKSQEMVELLVSDSRVDVNKTFPLDNACHHGMIDIARVLLSHPKIQVNKTNSVGWTVLMAQWSKGNDDMVKLLLSCPSIQVNFKNDSGQTALFLAIQQKKPSMIRLLRAAGAR
jgi:ankyrin repeat protein